MTAADHANTERVEQIRYELTKPVQSQFIKSDCEFLLALVDALQHQAETARRDYPSDDAETLAAEIDRLRAERDDFKRKWRAQPTTDWAKLALIEAKEAAEAERDAAVQAAEQAHAALRWERDAHPTSHGEGCECPVCAALAGNQP